MLPRLPLFFAVLVQSLLCLNAYQYQILGQKFRTVRVKLGNEEDYVENLLEAGKKIKRRFFFPNHAGINSLPLMQKLMNSKAGFVKFDLPELDELDNLHCPENSLKLSLKLASATFGSQKTWYLVNGSTGGILIAMFTLQALFERKNKLEDKPVFLIGRNSHKSVFDGLKLTNCEAILLPVLTCEEYNIPLGLNLDSIEEIIKKNKAKICGLIITRPTYEGVYNSKEEFCRMVNFFHQHEIPVLVDEAHGAHLKFFDGQDALSCGADIVVQSAHKGLMTLSQTALIHLGRNLHLILKLPIATVEETMHEYFSSFTTTSPNSMLLASLHASISHFSQNGSIELQQAVKLIADMKKSIQGTNSLRILDSSATINKMNLFIDPLKLNVQFHHPKSYALINSVKVDDYLCEEKGIFCELNRPYCVTYVLSPAISAKSLSFLLRSLRNQLMYSLKGFETIDESNLQQKYFSSCASTASRVLSNGNLLRHSRKNVKILTPEYGINFELIGAISADTLALYPPGIPFLVRGERVQLHQLQLLIEITQLASRQRLPSGCLLQGMSDPSLQYLQVYS